VLFRSKLRGASKLTIGQVDDGQPYHFTANDVLRHCIDADVMVDETREAISKPAITATEAIGAAAQYKIIFDQLRSLKVRESALKCLACAINYYSSPWNLFYGIFMWL
jgi:hypothetical protein